MGDKMLWMELEEMNLSVHGATVNSKGPRTKPLSTDDRKRERVLVLPT